MIAFRRPALLVAAAVLATVSLAALPAGANHSWGDYHWARTSNPFTLKLGDNVSGPWDAALGQASTDWTASAVLDTQVVAGASNPKSCRATVGVVEVCNAKYGSNGWLGLATIWAGADKHITQATVKLNDSYFAARGSGYNTPEWRRFVTCQEVGHTFGLGHQDEDFGNANLGSCMDYTNDPATNLAPNAHDFEQLELIYNSHDDGGTTVAASTALAGADEGGNGRSEWGRAVKSDADGRPVLFEREMAGGRVFTFVVWAL